jgi:hypothetical protein
MAGHAIDSSTIYVETLDQVFFAQKSRAKSSRYETEHAQ